MLKSVRTIAITAALLGGVSGVVLAPTSVWAAQSCADQRARQALEVRVLQSELMVAALTCGERPSYNAFVTNFKPFLKSQGVQLRTFFVQQYGPSVGPTRMNRMVTRLANTASQNSISVSTQAFCAQAKQRFAKVLAANPQGVAQLARISPTANDHGVKSCVEVANSAAGLDSDHN